MPSRERGFWKEPLVEVSKAIDEAPDAVRDRFAAWRKARSEPGVTDEAQFALAMSGYVAGHELRRAGAEGRRDALEGTRPGPRLSRRRRAGGAQRAGWPQLDEPRLAGRGRRRPTWSAGSSCLTRIVQLMPPPRHDDATEVDKTMLHRVVEDENNEPTEYAVRLPPEYHPLRSYPAVVVLHSGQGPTRRSTSGPPRRLAGAIS